MAAGKVNGADLAVTPADPDEPASVADQAVADGAIAAALDADGRRRIVLTRPDQRQLNAAIRMLQAVDLGMVICCKRCDQPLVPEEVSTVDAGYGCTCSRVHYRGGVMA